MPNRIIRLGFVLIAFSFICGHITMPNAGVAAESENADYIYASFLWAGTADTDCRLFDTPAAENEPACQAEYSRVESEIIKLVERKNAKGSQWKWGVFAKCAQLKNIEEYNAELERWQNRCKEK